MNLGRHRINYILVEGEVKPIAVFGRNGKLDLAMLTKWAQWYEDIKNRRVAENFVGPFRVSTVFLGIDHCFGDGPPILFETMVFNHDDPQKLKLGASVRTYFPEVETFSRRYCTLQEARRGHANAAYQLRLLFGRYQRRVAAEIRARRAKK